jgi:hypothetical protein
MNRTEFRKLCLDISTEINCIVAARDRLSALSSAIEEMKVIEIKGHIEETMAFDPIHEASSFSDELDGISVVRVEGANRVLASFGDGRLDRQVHGKVLDQVKKND